jgi:PAS domain S-box-containing protein
MQNQESSKSAHILEDYLSRLLHSNVIGIVRGDIDGKIHDANDAYLNIIGYTREELKRGEIRWDRITPPEFLETTQLAMEQLRTKGFAPPYQKEYFHKDGHRIPVTVGITALDTASQLLGYVIDHTDHREMQNRLSDSEQKFRMLTEAIPQLVWTAGDYGVCDYSNKRYLEVTGIDPAADGGLAWKEFIHPADLTHLVERVDASPNEKVYNGEVRFRTRDGSYRWHLIRGEKFRMADGTTKWIGSCTDIEDQKRVEEELREAMARFRTLAESIPQIVWTAAPDGGINFFNHRWLEYTGLSLEQSLSGGWKLLIHPDDLPAYEKSWKKALDTGDTFECRFRLKRAVGVRASGDGYREHLCRSVASLSSTGKIIEWFGTWTDIHDKD